MVSSIILLVAAATAVTNADVEPYEPSGWKPSGATFTLPNRNNVFADQLNHDQSLPLTPNFNSPLRNPDLPLTASSNRQFTPLFQVPQTLNSDPSTIPTSELRPSAFKNPSQHAPTKQELQDNFVHKSILSLLRPLQDIRLSFKVPSSADDQSQLSRQYLPSPDSNYETGPTFKGFDNAPELSYSLDDGTSVTSGSDFTYETPPADSEASVSRPQSYGPPSEESKTQRIVYVVLPFRQLTSTGAESNRAEDFSFGGEIKGNSPTKDATPARSPRKTYLKI